MRSNAPSSTALMVARGVAFVASDPRWQHLVPPEMANLTRILLTFGSTRLLPRLESPAVRAAIAFAESLTAQGILLHYVLRKRRIEAITQAALADGFRQVVILGAGLDTLALRLHRTHSAVTFIEIDHPATQQCKRSALQNRGGIPTPGANLHLLAADLIRSSLPDVLRSCATYRMDQDTLFIAEGLLMYLTAGQITRLLSGIYQAVHPSTRCRLAFTFVEKQINGLPDFDQQSHALRLWLRLRGEPFRWGIRQDNLPIFLTEHGFTVREIATPAALRIEAGIAPIDLVSGDLICVAERRTP